MMFVACGMVNAQTKYVGKITKSVNLRIGPGTQYESLGLLSAGFDVSIIDCAKCEWIHVVFYGADSKGNAKSYEGYVSSSFVSLKEVEDVSKYERVYISGTEERREIGCTNISPTYDNDSGCRLNIDATNANYDTVIKLVDKRSGRCISNHQLLQAG